MVFPLVIPPGVTQPYGSALAGRPTRPARTARASTRWTVRCCLVIRCVKAAVVVLGHKRWSDCANNQHPTLGFADLHIRRSHRAEAHQDVGGRFGSDGGCGVQPRQLGRLLTMSVQDEGPTRRVGCQRARGTAGRGRHDDYALRRGPRGVTA